jgi:pSer/pThr/pTyr-binding forkhead associated (FHA) protein
MEFVFVEEKPMEGTQRPVQAGTTVGRAGADVALTDPEVSRRHAVFHQVDAGLGVEDLDSRNGTYVNDQPIKGITTLSDGDVVRFGNTVWRLGAAAQAPEPGPAQTVANSDPDRMPTSLRQVVPQAAVYGEMSTFEAAAVPSPVLGFSAARRLEATVFCYIVVLGTAIGVALFFVTR